MSNTKVTSSAVEHVSPQELYDVIVAATSQDPARVQASSKRLKEMLDMFGTYDSLHEIAAQRTLPLAVRQQAIIQFKNAALSHWRSRKVISDEQRTRIRSRCLTFLDEDDETIAGCNHVVVSKISRLDFPNNWPNLFNDLLSLVQTNLEKRYTSVEPDTQSALVLRRSFTLLNSVIKEFASIKMLNGVKTMSNLVSEYYPILYDYYSKMSAFITPTAITEQNIGTLNIRDNIWLAHLVYKCLAKMSIWSWNRIDKVSKAEYQRNQSWLQDLFQNTFLQLRALTEHRRNIVMTLNRNNSSINTTSGQSVDILTKHIRLFALPMCNDMVLFYWSQVVEATSGPPEFISDTNEAIYPVRFLVQGMVLFKESLPQWTPARKDGTPNPNTLSQEFVENAVRLLVTRFMPLNPTDLENWMADPEEWFNAEDKENDQWEYEIRPCSERVLLQLANQYAPFVTPLLQSTFQQFAAQQSVDLQSVVQKEALYCAIGRCAHRLKGVIPFEQWLEQTLSSEARNVNPNYPIIKRRIAWLIGKWVSEDCTSPNNPRVWEILVHLLQDRGLGSDPVVRLTAAVALKDCLDTLELDIEYFAPFLPTTVSELVRLLGEADTFEGKRRIDHSLNVVIEQAGKRIVPFVNMIVAPLPHLCRYSILAILDGQVLTDWTGTEAGEQWLFKGSMLVTVTKLVDSIGQEATNLAGIIVPLVRESLSPGIMVNLDEDGLNLWSSALRNTLTISSVDEAPALFELIPRAIDLLSSNMDLLGKTISVIESYVLLDAPTLLQAYGIDLFKAFLEALRGDAVTVNMKDMLITLNLLTQAASPNMWGEAMHASGLFAHILMTLVDGEIAVTVLTEHIYLLARIVMADRNLFLQLMSATAIARNVTETYLYEGLLDQWWGKFDNMSEPRHRKLTAMGIAALVSTARLEVLQRLPVEIFNLWVDVFCEIREAKIIKEGQSDDSRPPSPNSLRRHWELDDAPESYYQGTQGTAEYGRRKALYDRDPVRSVKLSTYVGARLREAEALCGPENFQRTYLSKVEPAVIRQIQSEIAST